MNFQLPSRTAGWLASLLSLWAGFPTTAVAQTRILFVGNSFTHGKFAPVLNYNAANVIDENYGLPSSSPRYEATDNSGGQWSGIPGIFKKFTDQAGLNYEVHLEALAGNSLENHYNKALSVINQAKWDQVVLQELSTGPLPSTRGGNRNSFYTYATKLEQTVHAANPAAQLYLYETWARADMTYPTNSTYSGFPVDTMTQDLRRGTYAAFARNGRFAAVAPAGEAWMLAIKQGVAMPNPYSPVAGKLNLWGSDNYHPSKYASYLNACVLLYTITGVDPRTLGSGEQAAVALGIAPATAATLQAIAYQQVSPAPLPVRLVAFTAHATGPATVALAWQTASEVTSAYFEVERSADGVHFTSVGRIAAAGNSTTARTYTYQDAAVPASTLYYRLHQVDQTGKATYSPVRPAQLVEVGGLTLYPNPAQSGVSHLSGVNPGAAVRVLDMLGQVIRVTTADRAGTAVLAGLPAGLYLVRADSSTVRLSVE
jgi:hypothetical protein